MASLVVYLFTRLFRLTDFPINFMVDESKQTLFVQQLIDQVGNLISRQRFAEVVNTKPILIGPVAWFGTPDGEMFGHLITRNVKFGGFEMPGAIEQPLVHVGGALGGVSNR